MGDTWSISFDVEYALAKELMKLQLTLIKFQKRQKYSSDRNTCNSLETLKVTTEHPRCKNRSLHDVGGARCGKFFCVAHARKVLDKETPVAHLLWRICGVALSDQFYSAGVEKWSSRNVEGRRLVCPCLFQQGIHSQYD